jgi:hypothetical protein
MCNKASILTCLLFSLFTASFAFSQGKDEKKGPTPGAQPTPEQMAEMMKKWQANAMPGENHRHLEHFVGSWDCTMKMWMGGPDTKPTVSKGTAETKWILGKRYIQESLRAEMKMPGPDGKEMAMPFEGLGTTGYDNFKKIYVGTWADDMGTQLLTMRGSYDPAKKTLAMYGEMDEPAMDVYGRMFKGVTRVVDKDTHVFEMYDLHVGENFKVMEITYKRK